MIAFGIRATLLTPLTYHGLMVQGGSATVADVLSDTALLFGLASALGWMPQGPGLPSEPSYREHLEALPFRASLLLPCASTPAPRLMPPQARKLNLDAEGGKQASLASVVGSGNVKDYFFVQSVAPGACYEGIIAAPADPWAGAVFPSQSLVLRMGLGLQGVLRLDKSPLPARVALNAHTGALWDRGLGCAQYYLHTLQASRGLLPEEAAAELGQWGIRAS